MTLSPIDTHPAIADHDAHLSINYGRYPVVMTRGEGARLWDADGKQYLDLFAGFGGSILGHAQPDLVAAVTEQAGRLWHAGNLFHTEPQGRLAVAIARHGFGGRSFFCHSGADANEAALKLTRLYGHAHPGPDGPRYHVITATRSFHGRTFGTMRATGQPAVSQGFDPLLDTYTHVPFNDLDAVRAAVTDTTVAVMVEPIQGEGGVNVPADGYLPGLRALCDERDLLLICDEVWTGCGRTGKWFAHQHWLPPEAAPGEPGRVAPDGNDPAPDLMTLAKGVGGGLPVGVCCIAEKHAALFDYRTHGRVVHATTLGGNCLSMAAAAAVFEVIERDGLLDRATRLGEAAKARLQKAGDQTGTIRQVRGKGLFLGIELDPADAWFDDGKAVVNRCLERGVLINATQGTVLRLAPPLNIDDADWDRGLTVLEEVLAGE